MAKSCSPTREDWKEVLDRCPHCGRNLTRANVMISEAIQADLMRPRLTGYTTPPDPEKDAREKKLAKALRELNLTEVEALMVELDLF